ncbi:MAG: ATP-binding protein, partial [Gammaproteobacteria bacterium]
LLKALEARLLDQGARCFYFSLSGPELLPRLSLALGLASESTLGDIANTLRDGDGITWALVDEADGFIQTEKDAGYVTLNQMRSLSEEGLCVFVLAGFWSLYQHSVLDYQSPLKNFGETLEIGALEDDASMELVTQPMETLRLGYANPQLPKEIIEQTGQRANLLGITCHEIVSALPADQREITAAQVHSALHSEKVQNALKGWDAATDKPMANAIDRMVVNATVAGNQFTAADLRQRLQALDVLLDTAALDQSLERLTLGFVLGRAEDGSYFYRVPLFREFMLRDDVEQRLNAEVAAWKRSQD